MLHIYLVLYNIRTSRCRTPARVHLRASACYVLIRVPLATYGVPGALYGVLNAVCLVRCAWCCSRYAGCLVSCTVCGMPCAAFCVPCTIWRVPHTACCRALHGLAHLLASRHINRLSRHVTCFIRRKEYQYIGNILVGTSSPQGNLA